MKTPRNWLLPIKVNPLWLRLVWISIALLIVLLTGTCEQASAPLRLTLEVTPTTTLQGGESAVVFATQPGLAPPQFVWSVSGTAQGKINARNGERIVYSARVAGSDTVRVQAITGQEKRSAEVVFTVVSSPSMIPEIHPH